MLCTIEDYRQWGTGVGLPGLSVLLTALHSPLHLGAVPSLTLHCLILDPQDKSSSEKGELQWFLGEVEKTKPMNWISRQGQVSGSSKFKSIEPLT